jgi:hypothetical protein
LETPLGAKEHRLEAYDTWVFWTLERTLRAILVAIAVRPTLAYATAFM